MFCSDEAVNNLLNYSKAMINTINKNSICPENLRILQYVIFAGMICYYGFEHINEIYNTFAKTKFTYDNVPVIEILKKYPNNIGDILNYIGDGYESPAFFQSNISVLGMNKFKINRSIYISSYSNYDPVQFLGDVLHEVNHIVNSINGFVVNHNSKIIFRCGVSLTDYQTQTTRGRILEETFNTLQTEEILNQILEFSKYNIDDIEIKSLLDEIRYAVDTKIECLGYDYSVPIIRPLYENKKFNSILKERRLDGNVKYIRDEFDSNTCDGLFNELMDSCDKMALEKKSLEHVQKSCKYVYKYVNSRN